MIIGLLVHPVLISAKTTTDTANSVKTSVTSKKEVHDMKVVKKTAKKVAKKRAQKKKKKGTSKLLPAPLFDPLTAPGN